MVDSPGIASLIDAEPFAQDRSSRERRLLDELTEEFRRQDRDCALFSQICRSAGWSSTTRVERLEDLPFLPAQYFKEAGDQLVSVDESQRYRSLSSSATSGRASTVVLDRLTARRQVQAVVHSLSSFIGSERRPMLVCDARPDASTPADLSARAAAMLGFMTFASRHTNILIADDRRLDLDGAALETALEQIAANDAPATVIGFTYLLYTAVLDPLVRDNRRYTLPPGSTIVHIGGWKKLEDRKVDRHQLATAAELVFGVAADRIVDCYGFTEQMGTVYPECAFGRKHAPAFADVIVRDPHTLRPLPDGEIGIGQFLSLVPRSYPGFSVLTDDLVRVLGRDTCPCGRQGTSFEILGRHKSAELRGCGDIIAEKIIVAPGRNPVHEAAFLRTADSEMATTPDAESIAYFVDGAALRTFSGDSLRPWQGDWNETERRLRAAQRRLAELSVDEIIGVLVAACDEWDQPDGPFAEYRARGLSFLVSFTKGGALQRMVDASLRGSRGFLDAFRQDVASAARLRALPRGIAVHWLAGNVPTLGFLSVMLSLATKNANILKVPQGVSPLLIEMLASLSKVRYRSPTGRVINGRILADAVEAMWCPRESGDARALSRLADVRVVWGGADAVGAVATLPKRYDCDDIVFGPKLSVAAIGREALSNEGETRRAARGIALDATVFDQKACASAHTVFVERGGDVSPRAFAALLAEQMALAGERIPFESFSGQLAGAVKSARMQHFLDGEVFTPSGLEWSVLFREKDERPDPVYGRTLCVRPIDDLMQIGSHLDRDTQVMGLALSGPRRLEVAEVAAAAGLDRITEPGTMAEFTAPWDGVFPVDRFVRWVSLLR